MGVQILFVYSSIVIRVSFQIKEVVLDKQDEISLYNIVYTSNIE
jgi:hypothetical protein